MLAAMTSREEKKQLAKAKAVGTTKPEKPSETRKVVMKRPASSRIASPKQPTTTKRPCVTHESSRSQYLFRSGDSRSKTWRYHDEESAKHARRSAEKMLQDELKRRGL